MAKQANQLPDSHSAAPATHLNPVCSFSLWAWVSTTRSSISGGLGGLDETDAYRIEIDGIHFSISRIIFKPGTDHATCLEKREGSWSPRSSPYYHAEALLTTAICLTAYSEGWQPGHYNTLIQQYCSPQVPILLYISVLMSHHGGTVLLLLLYY